MARRVRLIGVQVLVQAVVDDGENLDPLEVPPVVIPAAAWAAFDLAEVIAQLQSQVDAARPTPSQPLSE